MAPQDQHSGDAEPAALSALTFLGLGIGALHEWLQPLPAGLVAAALGGAYLTGGLPPAVNALRDLMRRRVLDIDL